MVASAKTESEEQPDLFPELGDSKEHKQLLRTAKAFHKAQSERAALLKTSKENVDSKEESLINQMHECKLTCFRYQGIKVEIIGSREKAEVKVDSERDDEGDDE